MGDGGEQFGSNLKLCSFLFHLSLLEVRCLYLYCVICHVNDELITRGGGGGGGERKREREGGRAREKRSK